MNQRLVSPEAAYLTPENILSDLKAMSDPSEQERAGMIQAAVQAILFLELWSYDTKDPLALETSR